jgi:hypothetical protein
METEAVGQLRPRTQPIHAPDARGGSKPSRSRDDHLSGPEDAIRRLVAHAGQSVGDASLLVWSSEALGTSMAPLAGGNRGAASLPSVAAPRLGGRGYVRVIPPGRDRRRDRVAGESYVSTRRLLRPSRLRHAVSVPPTWFGCCPETPRMSATRPTLDRLRVRFAQGLRGRAARPDRAAPRASVGS